MSRPGASRNVADSTFAIAANGFADGPAQALRDYLVREGARLVMVSHPLTPEQGRRHVTTTYADGRAVKVRTAWTPLKPPLSFAADPFIPARPPRVDAWFGFNPLAAVRGLVQRRLGRAGTVVLWSVDFTHDRFGSGSPLTRLYDSLDRLCCTRADAHVELSEAAREARAERLGLGDSAARTHIVPMGTWLEQAPKAGPEAFAARRVVFLGHLTARQGVSVLLDAVAALRTRGTDVSLDVIGGGDQLTPLKERTAALRLDDVVRFHGFVADHREVERLLAGASLAVAPYVPELGVFTRYADPGKLKNYLGAGLPIVLTDVPPNARELAAEAGAELVDYDPGAIADAIETGLASPERWNERREQALRYARRFDWPVLLGDLLRTLGFPD